MNPENPPPPSRLRGVLTRLLGQRHGGTLIFFTVFLAIFTSARVALTIKAGNDVGFDGELIGAYAVGFVFDVAMAIFFCLIPAILITLIPTAFFRTKTFAALYMLALAIGSGVMMFTGVSEWLFWDEFGARFNFIAVDYLVYTTEVLRNLQESYNLPLIITGVVLGGVAVVAALKYAGILDLWLKSDDAALGRRRFQGLAVVLTPIFLATALAYVRGSQDIRSTHGRGSLAETLSAGLRHMGDLHVNMDNAYNTELAKNGSYAFVAAFWSNEIDYDMFYPKLLGKDGVNSFTRLRTLLAQDNATYVSNDPFDITRVIRAERPARRLNIIQITVESLGAEFLDSYAGPGDAKRNLTPELDKLTQESVTFRHAYATGTRTVRGMEALSLSVPPTPGQAILRRPGCENLQTLGSTLRNHGYDCAFIYGGDGMFDNMNHFFSNNGYRIVDRPARMKEKPDTKITFENAWGVSDEDLFSWAIEDADAAFAAGKPFHQFVMTTSNHRPFTWPADRIAPELRGRDGGVAYTDYAIGDFIRRARTKPWFKDTVFVIVADHGAGVAGKRELEVRKYEIPAIFYAPEQFAPRRVDTLVSQVDLAPTLLGLLDFSYVSRNFGRDVLRPDHGPGRVFVSNYQKIGLIEHDTLAVLKPVAQEDTFACDLTTGDLTHDKRPEVIADAIAWYGCAASLFKQGKLKQVTQAEEHELLARKP